MTAPGDVLIRDMRLWHRGTSNTSTDPRVMLALIYQAASEVPGDNGQPLQFGTHAATVLATSPVRLLPLYVPESEAAQQAMDVSSDRSHRYWTKAAAL